MPSAFRPPLPRMGVAWPPDPGLQRTLLLSLIGHGLLILLLFSYLNNWLPNEVPNPVYRVEILGLEEIVPAVPPTPIEPPAPPEVVLPPPVVAAEPPPPVVEPPPQVQPATPVSPPVANPVRELPQPQRPVQRVTSTTVPTQSLPASQVTPVPPVSNEPDLNAPRSLKPVSSARPQAAPQLEESNVIAVNRGGAQLDAPSTSRSFQQRSSSASTALPDAAVPSLPAVTRSADIVPAPVVRGPQAVASRNPATVGLPVTASSPLPATARGATDLAPPGVSVAARPQSSKAAVPAAPQAPAVTLARRSGPDLAAPAVTVGGGPVVPSPRSVATPALADSAATVGASQSGVKIDQASLAFFRGLKTCLDTEEEMRLKTRLATLLEFDKECRAPGGTTFYLVSPVDAYSLRVGVRPGSGVTFRDRCEALRAAVQCVETR